jgi:hypothetical protein
MTVKKLIAVVGVLALVTAVGLFVVGAVFAQSSTPESQTTPTPPKLGFWGRGFGFWGGGSLATFDAVAEALGLTPTQLFEQLHSGKSLSDIAEAQGVDLQKVQDAVNAVQTQAMKDAIAQAVKDGKITQEQADWLLQGLEKGFLPGGRGFGFGHGMRGGMRGFGGWAPCPEPTTPAPGTSS